MKIREYQLKELQRARDLQDELSTLHISCPVMSWEYEIKNAQGDTMEKGKGKANSYTRNALNILAYNLGLCDMALGGTSFGDGLMSVKRIDGTITSLVQAIYATGRTNEVPMLILGIGTGAESLDDFAITEMGGTKPITTMISVFNSGTKKLTSSFTRMYTNTTESAIDITESGIIVKLPVASASKYDYLLIRDKFDAITLGVGESISWTYVTEVNFPS